MNWIYHNKGDCIEGVTRRYCRVIKPFLILIQWWIQVLDLKCVTMYTLQEYIDFTSMVTVTVTWIVDLCISSSAPCNKFLTFLSTMSPCFMQFFFYIVFMSGVTVNPCTRIKSNWFLHVYIYNNAWIAQFLYSIFKVSSRCTGLSFFILSQDGDFLFGIKYFFQNLMPVGGHSVSQIHFVRSTTGHLVLCYMLLVWIGWGIDCSFWSFNVPVSNI